MPNDRTLTPEELAAEGGVSADTWSPDGARAPAPPAPDDVPGAIAATRRYRPLAPIGQGGMGAVWRVEDLDLGRVVALKVIRPDRLAHVAALEPRFREEAQVTAQLQHPAIVPVYDIGRLPNGAVFYTMREVAGQPLDAVIDAVHAASAGGPWRADPSGWTWVRLVEAVRTVAQAVGLAHARGVLHRDLKPQNILVGDRGQVFVLDWGLAKVRGTSTADLPIGSDPVRSNRSSGGFQTSTGQVAGTYGYMPPEQAAGAVDRLSPASDVYALGAVLFRVLTGEEPRADPAGLEDGLARARAAGRIPDRLERIVRAAVSAAPEDRPADGRALATALTAWLDGAREDERARDLVENAEAALAALPPEERTRADGVLGRLLDADGRPARRHQRDVADAEAGLAVVDALREAGAIVRSPEGELPLSDESLLGAWPRLQALADDTEGRRLASRIGEAARAWEAAGWSADLLARGPELEALSSWAAAHRGSPTAIERAWLAACRDAEAAAGRRRRGRLQLLAVAAGVAAVVMGLLWLRAEGARAEAEVARQEALAAERQAHGDRLLAMGHAQAAAERPWDALALYRAATDVLDDDAAAERDIRGVVTTEQSVWRLPSHAARVWAVAFSPDGRWLASSSADGRVQITDWQGDTPVRTLDAGTFATVSWVAGNKLSVAAENYSGFLVEPETGAVEGPVGDGTQPFMEHHPVTGRALVARDKTLRWADDEQVSPAPGSSAIGWFSPEGDRIGILAMDAPLALMRSEDLSLERLVPPPNGVQALRMLAGDGVLAFSQPAGQSFPTAALLVDHDADPWIPLGPLTGHGCSWRSFSATADGQKLTCAQQRHVTTVSRTAAGVTRLWSQELEEARNIQVTTWSPDGRTLVAGLRDGGLLLLDGDTGTVVVEWKVGAVGLHALDFTPDGDHLAIGLEDGRAEIWRLPVERYRGALSCDGLPVRALADVIEGDGEWLYRDESRRLCRAALDRPREATGLAGRWGAPTAGPDPGSVVALDAATRAPWLLGPGGAATPIPHPEGDRYISTVVDAGATAETPWLVVTQSRSELRRLRADGTYAGRSGVSGGTMLVFPEARRLVNVQQFMGDRRPMLLDLDTLETKGHLPIRSPAGGGLRHLVADRARGEVLTTNDTGEVQAFRVADGAAAGPPWGEPLEGGSWLGADAQREWVVAGTNDGALRA